MSQVDISAALRPGVYILRAAGRVVFVGAAKAPAKRLYAHLIQKRGDPIPRPGMPRHPVAFDAVEIRPCLVDDLAVFLQTTRLSLGWSPE